jgi:phage tail-like protein
MPIAIGEDALAGYSFQFEVDGISLAQFKEVSGLSVEITVIEQKENKTGGIPVLKKLPGERKYGDVTLKRGKTDDKSLIDWFKKVQDGDVDGARKNASLVLYDYTRGEVARYNFQNCWPSKWTLGSVQAAGNEVLLEEVTIVSEGIEFA